MYTALRCSLVALVIDGIGVEDGQKTCVELKRRVFLNRRGLTENGCQSSTDDIMVVKLLFCSLGREDVGNVHRCMQARPLQYFFGGKTGNNSHPANYGPSNTFQSFFTSVATSSFVLSPLHRVRAPSCCDTCAGKPARILAINVGSVRGVKSSLFGRCCKYIHSFIICERNHS
jgi:hypothetical protein